MQELEQHPALLRQHLPPGMCFVLMYAGTSLWVREGACSKPESRGMIPLPKRYMSRLSQSLVCLLVPLALNVSSEKAVYVYLSERQGRCSNRRFSLDALHGCCKSALRLFFLSSLRLGETLSSLSSCAVCG